MAEEVKMSEVVDEIKNADEKDLKQVVEQWLEKTRTEGMHIGAQYISYGIAGIVNKHLDKPKPSLRDYERCVKDIRKIIAVQIAKKDETAEEQETPTTEEVEV